MRHILKEVNQVSLRRDNLFFLLRAKQTALITEFYIVSCVESLSS